MWITGNESLHFSKAAVHSKCATVRPVSALGWQETSPLQKATPHRNSVMRTWDLAAPVARKNPVPRAPAREAVVVPEMLGPEEAPPAREKAEPVKASPLEAAVEAICALPIPEGEDGLLCYKKWWFLRDVDISVGRDLLSGIPMCLQEDTLRVMNDTYSYFIPMGNVNYIRSCDGLCWGKKNKK